MLETHILTFLKTFGFPYIKNGKMRNISTLVEFISIFDNYGKKSDHLIISEPYFKILEKESNFGIIVIYSDGMHIYLTFYNGLVTSVMFSNGTFYKIEFVKTSDITISKWHITYYMPVEYSYPSPFLRSNANDDEILKYFNKSVA